MPYNTFKSNLVKINRIIELYDTCKNEKNLEYILKLTPDMDMHDIYLRSKSMFPNFSACYKYCLEIFRSNFNIYKKYDIENSFIKHTYLCNLIVLLSIYKISLKQKNDTVIHVSKLNSVIKQMIKILRNNGFSYLTTKASKNLILNINVIFPYNIKTKDLKGKSSSSFIMKASSLLLIGSLSMIRDGKINHNQKVTECFKDVYRNKNRRMSYLIEELWREVLDE